MNLKDKNFMLFETKVFNNQTQKLGLVLYTWIIPFTDSEWPFAKCVVMDGKSYNTPMNIISPLSDYAKRVSSTNAQIICPIIIWDSWIIGVTVEGTWIM